MRRIGVAIIAVQALLCRATPVAASALYVGDGGARAVLRFELQGGLPKPNPGSQLDLGFVPAGIALAPDGTLYVADAKRGVVAAYAPRSRGKAAPERTIETGGEPSAVATDPQSNLYVAGVELDTIDIYGPSANGRTGPIARLSLPKFGVKTSAIVVDAGGRAFVVTNVPEQGPTVWEYADPRGPEQFVRELSPLNVDGLAVDSNHELFVGDFVGHALVIAEFGPTMCCAYPSGPYPDRTIAPGSLPFAPTAIAVEGRYAFVASVGKVISPSIYVIDTLGNGGPPLATIDGSFLKEPRSMAVGP